MPSSSATCSTTTVSTIASRSVRVSQRCSIGRRNSTSRVGVAAGAAHERRQRDRADGPVVRDLRGVLDGVLDEPEPVLPARVDVGDDAEHQVVEALAARSAAPGCPGSSGAPPGRASRGRAGRAAGASADRSPTWCHPRREPNRDAGRVGGYRLPRESCPPVFAYRLQPRRGHHADLRLRRPDRCPRPAGDLRRAARLRPVRPAQRAAVGAPWLGGAPARDRPGRPGPVGRRPARARRRRPRGRPPGAAGADPPRRGDRPRDHPPRPPPGPQHRPT